MNMEWPFGAAHEEYEQSRVISREVGTAQQDDPKVCSTHA